MSTTSGYTAGMSDTLNNLHLDAWRTFITAHALLIERVEREMAAAGVISLQWYDVLIELYEAPARRLRQGELARAVVLSKSNVSRLVDRLEVAGLLTRERCETDKRGAYVILTETGAAAMRAAWPVYARGIAVHFAAHLSAAEAETFAAAFTRILTTQRGTGSDAANENATPTP